MGSNGWERLQASIYAADIPPPLPTNLAAVEELARCKLDERVYAFIAAGAGRGETSKRNEKAFGDWAIVPRVLREAIQVETATSLFGRELSVPILLGPVGMQRIVHPDGELATARAATRLALPMVLSMSSSYSIERVREEAKSADLWFQLYRPDSEAITDSLLQRAWDADYRVLVLTVDTWQTGWRPGDLDFGYSPFAEGQGAAIIFSDPVFRSLLARPPEADPEQAMARWLPMFNRTSQTWESLSDLRRRWPGILVVKGVQHVEDAVAAVDAGADGVVVSNHGGRHLDGAISSLEALPDIVAAVGGATTVLFDSGIRGGVDAVIALALGARAVLIGRPYIYGLAAAGEAGVEHVMSCIAAEISITMGNSGHRTVRDLGRAMLRAATPRA